MGKPSARFFDHFGATVIPDAFWGRGLNSFNDVLRGGFGSPDGGFVIEWRDSQLSRERLGYAETVRQLERTLTRCHPANRVQVGESLAAAKENRGETAFDWLVQIIRTHGPGGEEGEDGVELELK